jgi:cystathionine beta-lyase/cystathionine gamma-synthase
VEEVDYPKYSAPSNDALVQRPGAGHGGLFSLLLKAFARL